MQLHIYRMYSAGWTIHGLDGWTTPTLELSGSATMGCTYAGRARPLPALH